MTTRINKTAIMGLVKKHGLEYEANCIVTGFSKPWSRLAAMVIVANSGVEIRSGNDWGTVRLNGEQMTITAAFPV